MDMENTKLDPVTFGAHVCLANFHLEHRPFYFLLLPCTGEFVSFY